MDSLISFLYIAGIVVVSLLTLGLAIYLGALGAVLLPSVVLIALGWYMDSFFGGFLIFSGVVWLFVCAQFVISIKDGNV